MHTRMEFVCFSKHAMCFYAVTLSYCLNSAVGFTACIHFLLKNEYMVLQTTHRDNIIG